MPIPTFTTLPPQPQFNDLSQKMNVIVRELQNLFLSLDSLNVVSLTADNIDAGTINAGIVTIRADLTGGAYIVMDGDGIRINDGTQDVFFADNTGNVTIKGTIEALSGHIGGFTITSTMLSGPGIIQGGTIRTAGTTSYPRVELDSTGNIFQAFQNPTNSIGIDPDITSEPAITFDNGLSKANVGTFGGYLFFNVSIGKLRLRSNSDIEISAGGKALFDDWTNIMNSSTGRTLQQDLNSKQNTISGASGSFTSVDGKTVVVSNGIVTSII